MTVNKMITVSPVDRQVLFYISYEGDVSKYGEAFQASDPQPNSVYDVAYAAIPQV
jgi:hypothetical protein